MKKALLFISLLFLPKALLSQAPEQPHFLTVLVEFEDVRFTVENPAEIVYDMLCKQGFNFGSAKGSVADYYIDNSRGLFCPSFDVFGPVLLGNKMAAYGKDVFRQGVRVGDIAPENALYEACVQLDEEVDFSLYDADNDGFIDLILLVFAGYDQAAGGPSDALWAQQWNVQRFDNPEVTEALFDEVRLGQYIATAELRGASGTALSSIGSICHELGHFLGLPDFFDTDNASGGNAGGPYGFSLMGSGLYNDDGDTPPSLNALELSLLGWINESDFEILPEGPVRIQDNTFFVSFTETEGEFFLYEYRDGKGWDAPLPEGLVLYHVDRSERTVGEYTARELWDQWREHNRINALASHPCFYLIPSAKPEALAYDATLVPGRMVYPGLNQVLFYEPVDWEGQFTGVQLTNITQEEDGVRVWALKGAGSNINGRVLDAFGAPLEGVILALEGLEGVQDVSQADGFFRLDLPGEVEGTLFTLMAAKDGYLPVTKEISLENHRMVSLPLTLPAMEDATERPLSKYDKQAQLGYFATPAVLGGVRFTAQDLFPYVGQHLTEISFYPYMQPSFEGDVYVVVDLGGERVLTQKMDSLNRGPYFKNSLDISEAGIIIPEGLELVIGYGSPSSEAGFRIGTVHPAAKGNSFYSPFNLEKSSWKDMFVKNLGIYMDVALSGTVTEQLQAASLTDLGYSYIDPGEGRMQEGDKFPVKLHAATTVTEVKWTLDGEPFQDESVILTQETQVLQAHLKHSDGRTEVLELLLKVN